MLLIVFPVCLFFLLILCHFNLSFFFFLSNLEKPSGMFLPTIHSVPELKQTNTNTIDLIDLFQVFLQKL